MEEDNGVAVRIRLQRKGAKHMAFFRIVAADSRSPRDGRFIEQLGYYDPLKHPPEIKVETDKIIDWLSKGAVPSDTVESLLRSVGIMQTWHEFKSGKSLDELRHIEDEARKRLEAKASMEKRKKEDGKKEKAEDAEVAEDTEKAEVAKVAEKAEAAEVAEKAEAAEDASDDSGAEAPAADEAASEPDAKESVPETPVEEKATDDSGGEPQGEETVAVAAEEPSGGDDAPPESQEKKPE